MSKMAKTPPNPRSSGRAKSRVPLTQTFGGGKNTLPGVIEKGKVDLYMTSRKGIFTRENKMFL